MLRYRTFILLILLTLGFAISSCDTPNAKLKVTIAPDNYNFGDVDFGVKVTTNFVLTNKYSSSVKILSTRLAGTVTTQFAITAGGAANTIIAANNGTHTITVEFTAASGLSNCELEIQISNPDNIIKVIKAQISGTGIPKSLFTMNAPGNPPTYNFGQVNRGNFVDINGIISNIGNVSLNLNNVVIAGVGFVIQSGWTGNIVAVSGGGSHTLVIRFSPIATGLVNGTLTIYHNAANVPSPYVVNLVGESRGYGVTTFPIGITPLTSGNTVVLDDDEFKGPFPIGFNFSFFGHDYTELYISSNGYVGFGPNTSFYDWYDRGPYPRNDPYNVANIICLFASDLDPSTHGTIKYRMSGIAPVRLFTIEFLEINDQTGLKKLSGQIKLYETSNIIEICFATSVNTNWITAGIGIENIDQTQGVDFDGAATSPTSAPPTQNLRYAP